MVARIASCRNRKGCKMTLYNRIKPTQDADAPASLRVNIHSKGRGGYEVTTSPAGEIEREVLVGLSEVAGVFAPRFASVDISTADKAKQEVIDGLNEITGMFVPRLTDRDSDKTKVVFAATSDMLDAKPDMVGQIEQVFRQVYGTQTEVMWTVVG